MSEVNETQTSEREQDNAAITEPTDEYPGSFFRILAPPSLNDTWSLN